MALGLPKKRNEVAEKVDPIVKEKSIQKKMYKLANAIKIPAVINQFKTTLEETDEQRVFSLFSNYKPETREEKRKRLESADPRAGPKPVIIKFGLKHVTDLIEQKRLKLVLIAADTTPITVVVWLPALCKNMGIPYAIVKHRAGLGALVNLKSSAAIGLEEVRPEHRAEFSSVIEMCNGVFTNQFDRHMAVVGGGRINLPDEECVAKETFSN